MRPLTYTELSAPTEDSADSVMYPNEGVIELTRRARIREREIGELEAQLREIREFVIPNDSEDPHESLMSELRAWDRHSSANIETGGKLQAARKEADDLRAKLAAAKTTRDEYLHLIQYDLNVKIAKAEDAVADAMGESDWDEVPEAITLIAKERDDLRAKLAVRTEGERTDTERLDHLENEVDREMRDVNPKGYVSLFRRNVPITRESIDADMEVPRG